ncbi:MAG: hypothetical protein ACJ8KX_04800 [Chthoniobacterales bacterium]
MQGPHYRIREEVTTSDGANQYFIDSDYGIFQADGNEMLMRRIKEVYAIANLKDVSKTEEFTKSLVAAAKSPLNAAKNIVKDPVKAVSNVPKGVMKFMGKAGNAVKGIGKKSSGPDPEGSKAEQLIGYSDAKRKIALSMGIDPYTRNSVIQKQLDDIAWASWAGGFAFRAVTLPITGPAGAALTVTSVSSGIESLIREKSPAELKAINRAGLRAMGGSDTDAGRIVGNDAFTPTQATEFVANLRSLGNVAGRGAFIHSAAENSSSESDALFCVQTAKLMSQIHASEKPLGRIVMLGDFPIAVATDGTIVLALQWDYAAWTPGAAEFAGQLEQLAAESGHKQPVMVVLSGQMSSLLQQELAKRNFAVRDHAIDGPLL